MGPCAWRGRPDVKGPWESLSIFTDGRKGKEVGEKWEKYHDKWKVPEMRDLE
jgi:hypothetical protein